MENPLLQFSPPWATMVDMVFGSASSASQGKIDEEQEQLMEIDALGEQLTGFDPPISFARTAAAAAASSSPSFKSWHTLSLDSNLLEELLNDTDVTSLASAAAPKLEIEASPCNEQQQQQQQLIQVSPKKANTTLTDCLADALRIISCSEPDALTQVWVPVSKGNKLFLTTQEQPYSVVPLKLELMMYRNLSTGYLFPSEGAADAYPGLPGRVFTRLTPEWTPNVQFYDSREYLRIRDAARCDVKGTVAVPILDPRSRSCLGVIELVKNVEKIEFTSELNIICKALQAVNLAAAPEGNLLLPEIRSEGRESVFSEIQDILRTVCDSHKLPFAQTWIPCTIVNSGSDHSFVTSSSTGPSLFTKNAPYHVAEPRFWGFHKACSEHTLDKGQGVAGKTFLSNQPSFVSNICSFSREEYPLVHYARFFNLGGAAAIRLRSSYTGTDDYVLEFFLPTECRDAEQQQCLVSAVSTSVQGLCRSLRTMSELEIVEEAPIDEDNRLEQERSFESKVSGSKKHSTSQKLESKLHKSKKTRQSENEDADPVEAVWSAPPMQEDAPTRRRRNLGEKTIGLDVLQQYFAGSLKDAAKSIGVCPTTLKRICRQYGISRWPSRKINKVNRSLVKLQGVIDSVQGIDGAVRLNSLTGELASAAAAAAAITRRNSTSEIQAAAAKASAEAVAAVAGEQSGVSKNSSCSEAEKQLQGYRLMKRSQSCQLPVRSEYRVKVEPRVHGSCAALAALQDGFIDLLNIPAPPPDDKVVEFCAWSSAEDLSRLEAGHFSSPYQSSGDCSSPSGASNSQAAGGTVTVKVTLGSDTVRFKMAAGFRFEQLKEEVSNRFKLEEEGFALRYLDDDAEWVMLDGDADLDECIDLMKLAQNHTIKLAVRDGNPSCHSHSSVKL